MSDLTVERLLDIMTLKLPHNDKNNDQANKRMSKDVYEARKKYLTTHLDKVIGVLKANYWTNLTKIIENLPHTVNPIIFLTKIRKLDLTTTDRMNNLIYSYLLDLFVVVKYLKLIDNTVEDSIDYEETDYDD